MYLSSYILEQDHKNQTEFILNRLQVKILKICLENSE